jgi:hypothetical protein
LSTFLLWNVTPHAGTLSSVMVAPPASGSTQSTR